MGTMAVWAYVRSQVSGQYSMIDSGAWLVSRAPGNERHSHLVFVLGFGSRH